MNSPKIVSLDALPALVSDLKKAGKKIVTTNGAFDLLHIGHVRGLEESKRQGDVLIVGVNSDASIKKNKSPLRPIISEIQRAEMLAALSCVDYVVIFQEERPLNLLDVVRPHTHTKGGEYDPEKLHETEFLRKQGTHIVSNGDKIESTTNIIERILSRYGKSQG